MRTSSSSLIASVAASIVMATASPVSAQVTVEFVDEVFAYDQGRPAIGTWIGNVQMPGAPGATGIPGATAFAALHVTHDDESGYTATIILFSAAAFDKAVENIEVDEASLAFSVPIPNDAIGFSGSISDDGQRYIGAVTQGEADASFEFGRAPMPLELNALAFTGALQAGAMKLEIAIVLAKTPGGNWVGHFDAPAQGVKALPIINISADESGKISGMLPVPPGGASIDASLNDTRRQLSGTFHQSGMEIPLELKHDPNYEYREIVRPQDPVDPLPYQEQEIVVEHPDGFALTGTLTIPESASFGEGPFPTAILISGSGQQDRNESLLGHRPFLVIADHLTRHGIAVMRYDDRGVGGSGGLDTLDHTTSIDFAHDALAVARHMRTLEVVDHEQIGFIGHSEGGLIAPLVATLLNDDESIAFMVLMAGPGVVGRELIELQGRLISTRGGMSDEEYDKHAAVSKAVIDSVLAGAERDEAVDLAVKLTREAGLDEELSDEQLRTTIKTQLTMLTNEWMKFFLTYDPADALRAVRCPVLAINGTTDLQVWHEQNLDAIERIMTEAGGDITIKRYEGLNHLFQPSETGNPSEYATIEITFDESVMDDMVQWIHDRVGG